MLTVGSLFSGIGGLDLGLERAGMRVIWQCEIDPFCRAVLAKHWPGVPCYEDITAVDWQAVERPDVLCGGFPCQDISTAGQRAGIKVGTRSGLWYEYAKAIRILRPRFIIIENVAALLVRGLGIVLSDLAEGGYDAEWQVLPAAQFGAPHWRHRLFIIAYPTGPRLECMDFQEREHNATVPKLPSRQQHRSTEIALFAGLDGIRRPAIPGDLGVDDGLPAWLDRIKGVGNAVAPNVAEYLGRCVMEAANA